MRLREHNCEPAFMSTRLADVTGFADTSVDDVLRLAGATVATPNGTLMDLWARAIAERAEVDYRTIDTPPERIPYGLRRGNVSVGTAQMVEEFGLEFRLPLPYPKYMLSKTIRCLGLSGFKDP